MRMTGQNVPQSKSGRSRPSVRVAKNHSPITRMIAPKIRDAFRPLSDAGGRQDWFGGGAASVRRRSSRFGGWRRPSAASPDPAAESPDPPAAAWGRESCRDPSWRHPKPVERAPAVGLAQEHALRMVPMKRNHPSPLRHGAATTATSGAPTAPLEAAAGAPRPQTRFSDGSNQAEPSVTATAR